MKAPYQEGSKPPLSRGVGGIKAPLIKKDQSPPYQGGLGESKPLRGSRRIKAPYQEGSKPLIKKDQSPPYQGGLGGSKPLIKKDQSPPYQGGLGGSNFQLLHKLPQNYSKLLD
ncbi:MAG: hypothetical protein EWV60_19895 [Microcystis sp. Msp_OC_L_20101000_S702]|nr:MAG: hypothetical protein EWV60_19895 [Microcystis sp. Msp_OC_L_20101000_S702]